MRPAIASPSPTDTAMRPARPRRRRGRPATSRTRRDPGASRRRLLLTSAERRNFSTGAVRADHHAAVGRARYGRRRKVKHRPPWRASRPPARSVRAPSRRARPAQAGSPVRGVQQVVGGCRGGPVRQARRDDARGGDRRVSRRFSRAVGRAAERVRHVDLVRATEPDVATAVGDPRVCWREPRRDPVGDVALAGAAEVEPQARRPGDGAGGVVDRDRSARFAARVGSGRAARPGRAAARRPPGWAKERA